MPNKKVAKIDIVKAIAGVSFATLAAIGGSSNHPLLAGLAAIPAAGLAVHNTLGDRLAELKSQKEKNLEIPPPFWWAPDFRSWQNLCTEVENRLPQILWIMQESMQREEQVMTRDRVREVFIEAITVQYLTSEHNIEQKRRIGEFLAIPILQKLEEVLQPIIEQIQQEGMLMDERRTALHTEQAVRVLEKIHEQVSGGAKSHILSDEKIATLRKQYYDDRFGYWKMLDFKGIMRIDMNRPISIPLTEVFILPDVLSGVPEYETLERETEEFRYGSHARKAKLTPPQRESLQTVLAKHHRLVILGDPGSGKSTLLKYLLLQLVQGSDAFTATFPQMADIAAIVPLYMPLAAFAEIFLSNAPGTRSLEDFLPIYLHENYLGEYVNFIRTQLEKGNLFLLFDGLDEIPDAALRMNVVRHIEMFTQAHAANRFIVTSRIVGYKEASLSSEYQPYTLADFSEEQVKNFTQRWCPAYERWVNDVWDSQSIEDAATKEAEKLFYATQCKPAVKRLAVNPLLLTILALIQRQGIELPSHRVELFELCAITLIDTWVRAKGQSTHFSKNELIKILRPLAFWMHQHPAVGNIPEEELREQIVQQLIARSINDYEATKVAEQFLETVRGKTGILVERGKERYGFLHLTFEEYFAALELEKHKDRNEFIRKHLHDPRWREVILLTVGVIGILHSNEEEVTELVYNTIARAESPYEWALHRDLLFAGLCLADDVGIRVDREDQIVEQIVYLSLTSPYNGLQRACSSVLVAWNDTRIGEKATSLVLPILRQWETAIHSHQTFVATTYFEKKLAGHIEQLVSQYQEELSRHLRFQIVVVLACHQALEGVDWVSNLLGILSDEYEREKAITRFSDNPLSIVDALLLVLTDPDIGVKKKAVSALCYLGDTSLTVIDALLTALSRLDLNFEGRAVNALGRLGERQPRILDALLITLTQQPYIKEQAIKALWKLYPEDMRVVEAMLMAVVDVDERRLRQAAAKVLRRLNDEEQTDVIQTLLDTISNPTPEAKEALISILGQLSSNPDNMATILRSGLFSPSIVKEIALRALGYLGKEHVQVTHTLLSFVDEASENIRGAAINALGRRGEGQTQVVDALISVLSDSSRLIKYEGIRALERLDLGETHTVNALLTTFSSSDAYIRATAINALGRLEQIQPRVLDVLLSAVHDSSASVRVAAATVLGRLDSLQPLVLDALLSALIDFGDLTREVAIETLVRFGKDQPDIVNYLVTALSNISSDKLLQGATETYRRRLYGSLLERALSLVKDVGCQPPIPDILFAIISDYDLSESYFFMRLEAARALGNLGKKDPFIIDNLLSALASANKHLREAAARALEQLDKGQPRIIEALLVALTDPIDEVRESSASALGKLGKANPRVSESLLKTLSDPDSGRVRFDAAYALGQLGKGEPDIINALLQALNGSSWWGQNGAAYALGKLGKGQSDIINALISVLYSDDLSTRVMAARALGNLDDKQPDLVGVLLPMLSDPHWPVREEAARALGVLDEKLSQSMDSLLLTLSDSFSPVRYAAAYALRNCDTGETRAIEALLRTLCDSDWYVRGAAAFALATSQNEFEAVGDSIEQLLRQYDPVAHRELREQNLIFDALRAMAEKISGSKQGTSGSKA